MEPTQPRVLHPSGVAPTVRARSALVRAMSALDRWERAYLSRRGPERALAYGELMRAVDEARRALTEGDTAADAQDNAMGDHYAGMPGDSRR